MIRGREDAGIDDDDEELDVRVISEAEAKKKPAAAKKKPAPVAVDEDGDVEMAEVVPEEEDEDVPPAKKKAPAPAAAASSVKKAKTVPVSPYGEPCKDPEDSLRACAAGTLPLTLRFNEKWLPEEPTECPPYWSTLWAATKDKVDPDNNDVFYAGEIFPRATVVVFKASTDTRIQLFDAFNELALDGDTEEDMCGAITHLLAQERRTIKVSGKDARLGRAVASFCADTTLGNVLFKKSEVTPTFVRTVLQSLKDRDLLAEGGINRVSLIAIETRAEYVNAFSFKVKDLVPDSPCYIICLGGMGRTLRIRGVGVKAEDKKTKSKGAILGDFKAYSGLGIQLPGGFFEGGTVEVLNISGTASKDPNGATLPTIPMALLVVSTVLDSDAKAASGGGKKKKRAVSASKAKAAADNDAFKLAALRADIDELTTTHKAQIAGDKLLTARKNELMKTLIVANKGGRRALDDLHAAVADFHQKLTGEDYVLTLSNRGGDEEEEDNEDEDGDEEAEPAPVKKTAPKPAPKAAPKPKPAPPRKAGAGKMEEVPPKDDDGPGIFDVPEVTRKLVITPTGQVARRSARDSKPVTESKLSVAKENQVPIF